MRNLVTTSSPLRKNQRPRLQIPKSPLETALDVVAFAALLAIFLLPVMNWSRLPASVPQHFGFEGRPDAWGGKEVLLFLPAVNAILYAGLTILNHYPHIFNFPWPITAENAERQYRLARTMVSGLKALIMATFTFIQGKTIQVALGKAEGLGSTFLVASVTLIFGTIAVYFYKAYQAR